MKCPDLKREVMFASPKPKNGVGVDFQKYVLCYELSEMSRFAQKSKISNPQPHALEVGSGGKYQNKCFSSTYIMCPDL